MRKQHLIFCALALAALSVSAQEVAAVVSSVPILQQVAVPQQVCQEQAVAAPQSTTGAGGLVGAVAGGILGHQVGRGNGRTAATAVGAVAGAVVGDRLEAGTNSHQVQMQQTCTTQTVYENRTVGYNVTYEYAGRQYQTRMNHDPGRHIRVQVVPLVDAPAPAAQRY